jgi:hypothetical protein
MAKKPKSDNFDALGSVFDFLFEEAKKPPEKRKPIVPTGVAGGDMLTDGIFAALEKPGVFISDKIVGEFNSAIELQLGAIQFDDAGKVKVTTNSLIDFLKDPQGTVEKSIQRNQGIRKSMRAAYLGKFTEDFIASGWARKYGNLEAQRAVYGTSIARNSRDESYSVQRAIGEFKAEKSTPGYMVNRSAELLRRKLISDTQWSNLTNAEKEQFNLALLKEDSWDKDLESLGRQADTSLRDFLLAKFPAQGNAMYQEYINSTTIIQRGKAKREKIFDKKIYLKLENENLDSRISDLQNLGVRTAQQEEELNIYRKTKFILDKRNGESLLRTELERIKNDLRSVTDPTYRGQLKRELKDTRSALRYLGGSKLINTIGKAEGYLDSLQSIYGGATFSGLFASMLDGSYYDKNRNSFMRPTIEHKFKMPGDLENTLMLPDNDEVKRNFIKAHNRIGTDIYYFTPRSIFRTLFYNGEGFTYLLYKKLEKQNELIQMMKNSLGDTDYSAKDLLQLVFLDEEKLEEFFRQNGMRFNQQQVDSIVNLLSSSKGLKSAVNFFSTNRRIQQRVQNKINALLLPARRKIANGFLMRFVSKYGGKELLEQWIAKGGVQFMFKSIATAIASALGLAGGPVGSIVVSAITMAVTDLGMKAIGQIMVIGKYFLLGLVGLIVLFFTWSAGSNKVFFKDNFSYYHVPPGSVVMCSMYEEIELESSDDYPWGDAIIPPPSGEKCIFGTGTYGCSQGYKDVTGWSHQNYTSNMPVDLTYIGYIYAPQFCNSGDCRITRIAVINCRDGSNAGGIVELTANDGRNTYFFKLLHVKPLASLGEKLSSGQAVAVVQDAPEVEKGNCWTGKHLHLETKQNGSVVDPLELLQSFSCSVPDEKDCSRP